MNSILRNIRRILFDDGRHDRDFSHQAMQLQQARTHLQEATEGLKKAANILADLITFHAPTDRH